MNSPVYLTEYLNKIADDQGFVDHTLDFETDSKHGEGFISVIVAVTIKGRTADTNDEKELHLICKVIPDNEMRRQYFNSTALFEREVFVYNKILPAFEKFQRDRNIALSEGFFHYPKCYLAVADAVADRFVIILGNVKSDGYELWEKMRPVDIDTSSILLTTLGRYHGLSLAFRDQEPELFQEFLNLSLMFNEMAKSSAFVGLMAVSLEKAIENLTREDELNWFKNLRDNFDELVKKKLFSPNVAGQFEVLIHGDCWNNNFCFQKDENVITFKN